MGSGADVRGLTPRRPTKYLHHAVHDFLNKLYLCIMKKQPTQFDYSTLVSYMLPKGILDSFEINRIEEEDLGIKDETGTEIRVLHIYLDERDLRDEVWHDLKPNGFTEAREFNDFPVREYKVVLHVRRRRWLSADGKNI